MNFLLHIFILFCIRIFLTLSLNFTLGKAKILNFGHVGILVFSGYALWVPLTQWGWGWPLSLLAGAVGTVLASLVFAKLAIPLAEDAFGVMSIAVHLIILAVILNWNSVTRGALGIPGIPRGFLPSSMVGYALMIGIAALIWCIFAWCIDKGPLGRQMEALSEHPWYAESLGVSKPGVYYIAFLLGSIGIFLATIFYPPYVFLLSPVDYFYPTLIIYVTMVIAGGPGSFWGVVLATLGLTLLGEGLRFVALPVDLVGPIRLMLYGFILFAALWLRRDTIFPKQRSI